MTAQPASPNFYSGVDLDRGEHLRRDAAWIAARLGDPTTRFVPVWQGRNLIATASAPHAMHLSGKAACDLAARAAQAVFLGLDGKVAVFALDLSPLAHPEDEPALAGRGAFQDLRAVGPLLARRDGALLAYARGLVHWHRRHAFCGVCGSPTRSAQGGHVRTCENPACASEHFPRTDPAVIMLVHDGGDRCVLGRQAAWPEGMHSTLAGFVEPGESLEEAVVREVREEVGLDIKVADVRYHSSQPWPFPSSIMLGFVARAPFGSLAVHPHELAAAHWFTRAQLRASPEDERFRLPRRDSIARRLIEDWLNSP
ncbi:MAG: NAD(+) diphosphatase [Alphaproteobacteria bacterium]|nr:MAG: NAD(+) diphosphatase [Alphaproteobacteria bacterium]